MSAPDPMQPPPGYVLYVEGMELVTGQKYWVPPGTVPPYIKPVPTHNVGHTPSPAARRLYWTLQGPLTSSAISVMAEDENPDGPREAYFRQTLAGTTWHPISQESITEQPVASITVHEEYLNEWQDAWWTMNYEGFDDETGQPSDAMKEEMPPKFEPLVVTASNGHVVTIHDYLSAVHPWLVEHRNEIVRARKIIDDEWYTPSGTERLLVAVDEPDLVKTEDEDEQRASLKAVFEERQQQQQ